MRIIAGEYRGRKLHAPRGPSTRPTADRVKEALFNVLGPPARSGARFRVLDLYAGTGALALEALSRGADEALLVDEDRVAAETAEKNVAALGLTARARVLRREVGAALRDLGARGEKFDWIFVDPPYEGGALERALRLLGDGRLVAEAGLVIAEHAARTPPEGVHGRLVRSELRSWGGTAVSLFVLGST